MKKITVSKWVYVITGPLLSLITFVLTYYLDPLNFSDRASLTALPAFLFSIIILLITHYISTNTELEKNTKYSDRIYEAVKDYLHITKIGSPEKAIEYVNSRLPSLKEVKNTSFNILEEQERTEEKLYYTESYNEMTKSISTYTNKGLIWKDIGDEKSLNRFRKISRYSSKKTKNGFEYYKYRIADGTDLQINFIILEFKGGDREVLFNWDFRSMGQDPTVLISRDPNIIEMFYIQFEHLWQRSPNDHDKIDTKSSSKK